MSQNVVEPLDVYFNFQLNFNGLKFNLKLKFKLWNMLWVLQAEEAAAQKKRDQELAAVRAANLEEAVKKQEAQTQKKNTLLQGSRMALGAKANPDVASQRKAVNKVRLLPVGTKFPFLAQTVKSSTILQLFLEIYELIALH